MTAAATAPRAARLRFRRPTDADLEPVLAHWNDPDVRRYLWDDAPVARETARAVLAASAADFARAGFGLWIVEVPPATFGGVCGLRPVGDTADLEVLYSLAPALWGRGLATEAARAVVAWAFAGLGLARVLGGVDAPNVASRRVLEKIGMTPLEDGPVGEGSPVSYFAVTRDRFAVTSA